jgi:hypothetical protein
MFGLANTTELHGIGAKIENKLREIMSNLMQDSTAKNHLHEK